MAHGLIVHDQNGILVEDGSRISVCVERREINIPSDGSVITGTLTVANHDYAVAVAEYGRIPVKLVRNSATSITWSCPANVPGYHNAFAFYYGKQWIHCFK